MEFDLRPQWRLSGFRSHKPMCGQCGLFHHGMCFSNMQNCFKCGHRGHYARMCSTWTNQENPLRTQKSAKSIKKKERDLARLQMYLTKKQEMREMPFSNLRQTAFVSSLNVSHSIKSELETTKKKLKAAEASKQNHQIEIQKYGSRLENLHEECKSVKEEWDKSKQSNSDNLLKIQQLESNNIMLHQELHRLKSIRPEEQQNVACLRTLNENLRSELEEAYKENTALKKRLHQAEENADDFVLNHPFYLALKENRTELEFQVREIAEKVNAVQLREETILQQQRTIQHLKQQLDEYQQPQYYQDQNYQGQPQYFPPQQFQQQHSFRGNGRRNNYRQF